jgi:hypothetical protein
MKAVSIAPAKTVIFAHLYALLTTQPFSPPAHANLCTVIELEFHVVHNVLHKKYASTVSAQQVLPSKWIWNRAGVKSRARIVNAHEQTSVI